MIVYNKYFSKILNYGIATVLIFTIVASINRILYFLKTDDVLIGIMVIAMYMLSMVGFIKYKDKLNKLIDFNDKKIIIYILAVAFILRLLWVVLIPTQPTSDFGLMYEYAKEVAEGNYYGFEGNSYFARFAHDTITVLYFSVFYHFTTDPLLIIKFLNIIFGTLAVYLIYLILKIVFGNKSAVMGGVILAFFPSSIMYTSETMSENMAIPLYLLGIYMFIKGMKQEKKAKYLLICGLALSVANMFRMVGAVFLIAFFVYTLVYRGIKECIKTLPLIYITYALSIFIVSQALLYYGVTETHLWNSKEPSITSILKGTNIKYNGRWNEEDARIPEDLNYNSDKIKEVSKAIIVDRFKSTPLHKLVGHYVLKLSNQWGAGDFGAYDWTVEDATETSATKFMKNHYGEINILISLLYTTLLITILINTIKGNYEDKDEMNFFFILFGGFVLLYLISETQERYAFIVSWSMVVFLVRTKNTKNITTNERLTVG
ncbi:glycosyltransferase family 39 protein [Clostridium intestinale]|uniref:glycosyltransferase family 39 protein n=1 Tax=Clostridium intestinale TaxID=36845 RepID=UPI0028EF6177|nr:glycosyltransferase family 39 protein [Clostridium intestinale]